MIRGLFVTVFGATLLACSSGSSGSQGGVGSEAGQLSGTWRAQYHDDQFAATVKVELVLISTGTFSEQYETIADVGGTSLQTFTGNWEVLPDSVLRLNIEDWQPKQFCGPLGCSDILKPPGESKRFRFADANTLMISAVECASNCPELPHTRVQ